MRDDSHDSGELPRKVEGLPVAGYRAQDAARVDLVNANKAAEENILRQLDALTETDVDQRWLAIARTSIEQGFMALNRAIFRPARLSDAELAAIAGAVETKTELTRTDDVEAYIRQLPWSDDTNDYVRSLVAANLRAFAARRWEADQAVQPVECGWLLERSDSSPAAPLYFRPSAHGTMWTARSESATRFCRRADAEEMATSLAIETRVAEHSWS